MQRLALKINTLANSILLLIPRGEEHRGNDMKRRDHTLFYEKGI